MINKVSSRQVEFYRVADYVPVFSAFTNFTNLIQKAIVSRKNTNEIKNDPVYTYIKNKNAWRCLALIIFPGFGNLAFGIYDAVKSRKNTHQSGRISNSQNDYSLIEELKNRHISLKIRDLKMSLQEKINQESYIKQNQNVNEPTEVKKCYDQIVMCIKEMTNEQQISHSEELSDLIKIADQTLQPLEHQSALVDSERASHLGCEIIDTENRFSQNIEGFVSSSNVNSYFEELVKERIIEPEEKERIFNNFNRLKISSNHFERVIRGEEPFSLEEFKTYLLLLRMFTVELNVLKSVVEKNFPRISKNLDQSQDFRSWHHFDSFLSQPFQRSLRLPMLLTELKKTQPNNSFIVRLDDYVQFFANMTNAIIDKQS